MFFKIDVLKNLQYAQENTCVGVSSVNLQAWRPATLLKRDSNTVVSLWNTVEFSRQLFYRTPPMAASKQLSSILEILFNLEKFIFVSIFPIFHQFCQVHVVKENTSIEKCK